MGVLAIEVLSAWTVVSFVTGLLLGAAIRRGERVHSEEFLSAVFSTIEAMQASRSLNTRAI
jgi:hypothetical protein